MRALCPGCRHAPQSRKCLAGGLPLIEVVVVLNMESGKASSRAAGRGEVAVHGEVLMPLLSPALIGTRTSLSSHQGGETQLVS